MVTAFTRSMRRSSLGRVPRLTVGKACCEATGSRSAAWATVENAELSLDAAQRFPAAAPHAFCEDVVPDRAYRQNQDRGREVRLSRLPSLRTVRAVFPHTALRSVVARLGLSETKIGRSQTVQADFRKVVVWPAVISR